MNLIFFCLLVITLYISSGSTTESCPAIHKSSRLMLVKSSQFRPYSDVIMYEHVIGYCSVEKKIYGNDVNMVQEWIKANPTTPVYHSFWGTLSFDSLIGMYVIHFMMGLFILGCWKAIQDEQEKRK